MSSAAEKAKARREKILARSLKGNKVSMVTAETLEAEGRAKIEAGPQSCVGESTGEDSSNSKAEEAPKNGGPSSEEAPSTSTTESTTVTEGRATISITFDRDCFVCKEQQS